jgi:MOSC domain-containing protein YiiM
MAATVHELSAGLDHVRAAPRDGGTLELIVRRPAIGEREALDSAELDTGRGLVGDSWNERGSRPNPKAMVTVMNVRATALVAGDRERWPLAGDQLYVDLDLSPENLPAGTRLEVGSAVLEVSDAPHLGCGKFTARFGEEARELVNSAQGLALNLRGINTRVVQAGIVRVGDAVIVSR